MNADSEFVFELGVCAWAERNWPPEGTLPPDTTAIVARQLGTKYRRWDTVVVEARNVGMGSLGLAAKAAVESQAAGVSFEL